MLQDLLADRQNIIADAVHRKVHGHRIRAEEVDDLLVDVPEIGICCEALVDVDLLLVHLVHGRARLSSQLICPLGCVSRHLFASSTRQLGRRHWNLLGFFDDREQLIVE